MAIESADSLADVFGLHFVNITPADFAAGDASLGSLEHWDETYKNSAGLYDWYHEWPVYRAEFLCQMAGTISGECLSSHGDEALPIAPGIGAVDAASDQDAALALQKLDRESDILVVGCGNSTLGEDLFKEGFRRILSNDYSQVVIDRLANETYRDHPVLRFACMDCRCMPLPDAAFDFVLDKGTLDAVLCSGDVRDENAARMLDEVFRVLRPGGKYLMITTAVPAIRFPHLARVRGWRVYQRLLVDSIRLYVAVKDAI